MHKIAYLNVIGASEMFAAVGRPKALQRSRGEGRATDLDHWRKIDPDRLSEAMGIDHSTMAGYVVSDYTFPIPLHSRGAAGTEPHLRFCMSCAQHGYHSALFQLPYLRQCPIHHEDLLEYCLACEQRIPYSMNSRALLNPYGCSCGASLWPEIDKVPWNLLAPNEFWPIAKWRRRVERARELQKFVVAYGWVGLDQTIGDEPVFDRIEPMVWDDIAAEYTSLKAEGADRTHSYIRWNLKEQKESDEPIKRMVDLFEETHRSITNRVHEAHLACSQMTACRDGYFLLNSPNRICALALSYSHWRYRWFRNNEDARKRIVGQFASEFWEAIKRQRAQGQIGDRVFLSLLEPLWANCLNHSLTRSMNTAFRLVEKHIGQPRLGIFEVPTPRFAVTNDEDRGLLGHLWEQPMTVPDVVHFDTVWNEPVILPMPVGES